MKYLKVLNKWYSTFSEAVQPPPNDIATVAQIASDPRLQQLPDNSPLKQTVKNTTKKIDTRLRTSASLVDATFAKLNARLAGISQNANRTTQI